MNESGKFTEINQYPFSSLPNIPDVPGMISQNERNYLYWITGWHYSGCGDIVEVGSWLGKSANHLATGMAKSGHDGKLHCYDDFHWRWYHARKAMVAGIFSRKKPVFPGQDYINYFIANTSDHGDRIIPHKCDLSDIHWDGDRIEILFLDAPKKLSTLTRVFTEFGPALIPGKSIIIFQDYQYFPAYSIALFCQCLSDYLKPLHLVPDSATASFRVIAPIPGELDYSLLCNPEDWDEKHIISAWEDINSILTPNAISRLQLAPVLSLYDLGYADRACEIMKSIKLTPYEKDKVGKLKGFLGTHYPEIFSEIEEVAITQRIKWTLKRSYYRIRTGNKKEI